MSKDQILSWLPYILFYVLIFKDPYSALIPVSEPQLIYSPETTWLLDGESTNHDFAQAYNQHFAELIHDPENAFTYFVAAFSGNEYSEATQTLFNSFAKNGDNQTSIPLIEDYASISKSKDKNTIKQLLDSPSFQKNRDTVMSICKKIRIPATITHYEEPMFSNYQDRVHYYNRMMQYILNLPQSIQTKDDLQEALKQLRLMANNNNQKMLLLITKTYRSIMYISMLSADDIPLLEQDLPAWPDIKTLCTRLHRAEITMSIINPGDEFKNLITSIRGKNNDFFLDQNALLEFIASYYAQLEQILPSKSIDLLSEEEIKSFNSIQPLDLIEDNKESLAHRMLFSRSIKEQHKSSGKRLASLVCNYQHTQMNEFLTEFAMRHQPIILGKTDE